MYSANLGWYLAFFLLASAVRLIHVSASKWRKIQFCKLPHPRFHRTQKLHRQETPNSVGGSKSMLPNARNSSRGTVTNELDIISTAAAGPHIDLCRGSHKSFIQELPMSIPGELSYKHHCRASSRPECKDLLNQGLFKSFSQGPVQDHAKAPGSMSRGSPQDLQRPWPRSSCQDPQENLTSPS